MFESKLKPLLERLLFMMTMVPMRAEGPGFGKTLKCTGLSPTFGDPLVIWIHGTLDTAVHGQGEEQVGLTAC